MTVVVTGANSAAGRAILRRAGPPLEIVAAVRSDGAARALGPLGILVERPGCTYEEANVAPARAVVAAAQRSGVPRLVLTSAVGADPAATNRYWRS
ncbi:MAG TPA: hypothetical protein VFZ82_16625, partial [Methylomirabilota bacterium]|nr:hypothetical protein [Methylomirabilota bacterium]